MHDEVEEFKRFCRELSEHRRICTGEAMDISAMGSWPGCVRGAADFGVLVSTAYKLWRESWKIDVGFLVGPRRNGGPGWGFDQLIYELRTALQHADNREAGLRWDEWTSGACGGHVPATEDDWAACGRTLMTELNAAVGFLCKLAADGQRKESFRQEWQAKVSQSVSAIVSSVADDLGMYLHPGQRNYHVREVERRWMRYRLRPGETPADILASLAERSLVSEMDRLPCDHLQILEELRVLGTANATAVLRLAHAVAEISGTSGETYLELVRGTWNSLQPGVIHSVIKLASLILPSHCERGQPSGKLVCMTKPFGNLMVSLGVGLLPEHEFSSIMASHFPEVAQYDQKVKSLPTRAVSGP